MDDLYANWARVYDCFYPDRGEEVAFWSQLAQECGQHVLDLMCGTAEVSLGLARSGFRVLGVDLSPAMLAVGAERLAAAADYPARKLTLIRGDACHIPTPQAVFDFVLVGGSGSFNHLGRDAAPAALDELHRVLKPGGGLGMELVNPHLLNEITPERTFGALRPTSPGMQVEKKSSNRYDTMAGHFHIHQVTQYQIDGEYGKFEESFFLHVWQPAEVQELLEAAGFCAVQFYGNYNLGAFGRWSSDLLVAAARCRHCSCWEERTR